VVPWEFGGCTRGGVAGSGFGFFHKSPRETQRDQTRSESRPATWRPVPLIAHRWRDHWWDRLKQRSKIAKRLNNIWRTERDSNPRYPFGYTHFPGVRLQPLGHLSIPMRAERPLLLRPAGYGGQAVHTNAGGTATPPSPCGLPPSPKRASADLSEDRLSVPMRGEPTRARRGL
jgi:hypothetical protein